MTKGPWPGMSANRIATVLLLSVMAGSMAFFDAACQEVSNPLPEDGGTASAQGTARATATPLLKDLPPRLTDLIVTELNIRTLTRANLLVLEFVANNYPLSDAERDTVERFRGYLNTLRDGLRPDPMGDLRLPAHRLELMDPVALHARAQRLNDGVEQTLCARMTLAAEPASATGQAQKSLARDRHNLLVFYTRNVANKCGSPVSWTPMSGNSQVNELHQVLQNPDRAYAALKDYLGGSFTRRHELFIAIYFQYLALALEARDVNQVLRELLNERTDLRFGGPESAPRFPEMTALADTLDRCQKMKLCQ